ncbi:DUF1653 domain-containing protein [Aeromicrobium sp.]|nr:DUF1653 domain-containing protein [Candidatus Saccharibacteria bacterium]
MSDEFTPKPPLQPGTYRHYKGNDYEVIDLVCHSETQEWLVLYKRLYERDGPELWVRPYTMFIEYIDFEGKTQPRFAFVPEQQTKN